MSGERQALVVAERVLRLLSDGEPHGNAEIEGVAFGNRVSKFDTKHAHRMTVIAEARQILRDAGHAIIPGDVIIFDGRPTFRSGERQCGWWLLTTDVRLESARMQVRWTDHFRENMRHLHVVIGLQLDHPDDAVVREARIKAERVLFSTGETIGYTQSEVYEFIREADMRVFMVKAQADA